MMNIFLLVVFFVCTGVFTLLAGWAHDRDNKGKDSEGLRNGSIVCSILFGVGTIVFRVLVHTEVPRAFLIAVPLIAAAAFAITAGVAHDKRAEGFRNACIVMLIGCIFATLSAAHISAFLIACFLVGGFLYLLMGGRR